MALKRNERYPGRFENPTTGQPQGAFKNRTSPTSQDGSYLEADWVNDWSGFFSSLLSAAGITADGTVDSVGASQYFNALLLATPGRLLNTVLMTTSGTYTPTPGTKKIIVELVGGAGGSGGAAATASNTSVCTSPGCQGAYAMAIYTNPTAQAVTIGAGGAGGGQTGQAGSGGQSMFGSLLTCPGGQGSYSSIPTNGTITSAVGAPANAPTGAGIISSIFGRTAPNAIQASFGVATNYTAHAIGPMPGTMFGASSDGVYRGANMAGVSGNAGYGGACRIWEYA